MKTAASKQAGLCASLIGTSLIALSSSAALAHPGHDHAAPETTLIHMGMIAAPIAVAAAFVAWKILSRYR